MSTLKEARKLYYFLSPPIAERLKDARYTNAVVRKILDMFTKAIHSRSRKSGKTTNNLFYKKVKF
jgi:hypothetical protein